MEVVPEQEAWAQAVGCELLAQGGRLHGRGCSPLASCSQIARGNKLCEGILLCSLAH